MNNIYRTNFEQIKEAYAPVFAALERDMQRFQIDFYLIGAQSREVWTAHLGASRRTTRDIDYSVYIKDRPTWDSLTAYLVNEEGFERDSRQPYRFYRQATVDLIPFGGLEVNGEVFLHPPATELSVVGCREVSAEAVVVEGPFKVVTVPGLCILKLLSFNEKPDWRAKDWDDFLFLLKNYADVATEELFTGRHDDLIAAEIDVPLAAARMLGRNMQPVLDRNEGLKNKVLQILQSRLHNFTKAEIDQMYESDKQDGNIATWKQISETIRGIKDLPTPE